jgi:hypothetical protein
MSARPVDNARDIFFGSISLLRHTSVQRACTLLSSPLLSVVGWGGKIISTKSTAIPPPHGVEDSDPDADPKLLA